MDSQLFVEYEVVNPATNKSFLTRSFEEANEHFSDHWIVYEYHTSIVKVSHFSTSTHTVATLWPATAETGDES